MITIKNKEAIMCGIGTCLTLATTQANELKQQEEKPNVLFIILDDMCNWVGYLGGNEQVISPNLDKLAARSINFCNAYNAAPLSNPSRAALLSGIQPYVSGVYANKHSIDAYPIVNNSLFMPQHFRNNGYKTLAAGKIFHTKPTTDVLNNMWDDMSSMDGGYGPFITNNILPSNLYNTWRNFEAKTGPDTDFPDVNNSQKVIDFLGQSHDKPFFAAMGFYRPHNPYTAPKRYFDMYNLDSIKRPNFPANDLNDIPQYAIQNFLDLRQYTKLLSETGNYYEQMIRAYMACVTFADDRIGMIMDALEKSAYAENTWIVLVGDNGFHMGEKEHWTKFTLWRKANHVPFLIVPPKNQTQYPIGERTMPVSLIDIYPTLIDVCGLPAIDNEQLNGNNIKPLLQQTDAEWNNPCVSTYLPGNYTVHLDKWNFIRYNNNTYELYNIEEDEGEYTNLALLPEYQYMVDSLKKFIPTSSYMIPEVKVESIFEDLSTDEWKTEITRLNPGYVEPAPTKFFNGLTSTMNYFDKYALINGAIYVNNGTPNCAVPGVIHGNETRAVAFRIANTGEFSYIEMPTMTKGAGTMTLHVRNGNATAATTLTLQKYDQEYWTSIATLPVKAANVYSSTALDEVITYPINISEEVKLRIHGGDRYVQVYRFEIEPFSATSIKNVTENIFRLKDRLIYSDVPTNVSIYNTLGELIYKKYIENEHEIPADITPGIYILKSPLGSQKIIIN